MWDLFEVCINFFQGFLMIFFMSQMLPPRNTSRWWHDIVFEIVIGGLLCVHSYFQLAVSDVLIFFLPFGYALFTRLGTWLQRLFWTLVLGAIFTVITVLIGNAYTGIFDIELATLMESTVLRFGYVITTNVAITVSLIVMARIGRNKNDSLMSHFSIVTFIALLLLQFATIEILYIYQVRGFHDDQLMIVIDICIMIMVLMTILLYEIFAQSVRNKHLAEMKLQTVLLSQQHQHDMLAIYNEMLAAQHDLRHQVNMVRQLLCGSCTVDRDKILNFLNGSICAQNQFLTGCATVDAILTAKRALAEKHEIEFQHQPYPLQQLPIDETSFCILLSNILDNAIEAITRMKNEAQKPPIIELQFARSWNMFYIVCKNTMDPATIRKQGDRFLSAKSNKHIHGFGIENIRNVVTKNMGSCDFTIQGTQFVVSIMLPDEDKHNVK